MRGFVISAPGSAQGKTTLTLGLLRAFRDRGFEVRSAKTGPDYIDPAFHSAASGGSCVTLDGWAMRPEALRVRASVNSRELLVVEGAMGLFDGADDGSSAGAGSTADVAVALGLPVILVFDASRMGQGAAAIVTGLVHHNPNVRISGVILNRVGSARHEEMLRRAITPIVPVVGAAPSLGKITLPERHLGLVQASEHPAIEHFIKETAEQIAECCDLDAIQAIAQPLARAEQRGVVRMQPLGQRIAVAKDTAFAFVYDHLLDDWRAQGAEVKLFSPLADEAPDTDADAVYLPGGYPELHGEILARALGFKQGITRAKAHGALIYGECGGYMVMGRRIVDRSGVSHEMLNLLALETSFERPTRHLGYRTLHAADGPLKGSYRGHEFHYSCTLSAEGAPLFQMQDAAGRDLGAGGLRDANVMGSFAHIIEPG